MNNKITWETLDHIKEEKSSDWFWIVGMVTIAGAVLSIFFNNILLALIILLSAFASFMFMHTPAKIEKYELNKKGIVVGEDLYLYSSLDSFCVVDEDGYERDRILIKSNKFFMPLIIMPIGNEVEVDEVRDFLLEYLDEEEMREPPTYYIMSKIGF
ncbi:hypothetical protein GW764_00915 [Candidatus Parcubacteria bacterium]|nr:hypothetical protein [Candidatus Parcubacteria bacterium]